MGAAAERRDRDAECCFVVQPQVVLFFDTRVSLMAVFLIEKLKSQKQ
jgi:hypothetical protein